MYKKGHIHFIGIGGIGMSAIAHILKNQGYCISGCDSDLEQKSIKSLEKIGCVIYKGNNSEACHDETIAVVVYSSAIKEDNPEIQAARYRNIPTISRALMLAEIMRTKYSIAITGAHGKTTTTSMIAHILIEAKKDPTVIIGGHLKNISTNARLGNGDFLVAEADESDRSLLRLHPTLAVVTNIDLEHLDVYRDIDDIKATFSQFLAQIPFYGKAFVCIDDSHVRSILPLPHIKTVRYGLDEHTADIYAKKLSLEKDYSTFELYRAGCSDSLGLISVPMPGRHNALNALAAIAVAQDLEIPLDSITHALATFQGIERRFSFKGLYRGAEFFDDYGHHPTEIVNTLLVARKRSQRRLIVVFQPQRYTRTHKLWDHFINVFAYSALDNLLITDIYPASETPIPSVTSQNLVEALAQKQPSCPVRYVPYEPSLQSLKKAVQELIAPQDLVLLLGAGKINKLIEILE